MATVARPFLVVVSGKPGSGKTTLACRLAEPDALGLPLLQRDAIKAGLVASHGLETLAVRAVVVPLSFDLFFGTIAQWLRAGVSLIAEHSLDSRWHEEPLRDLISLAHTAVIYCDPPDEVAARRFTTRESLLRGVSLPHIHATKSMQQGSYDWRRFDSFDLGVPELRVDTSDGYAPDFAAILTFCRENHMGVAESTPEA
jgi:predicted kinase